MTKKGLIYVGGNIAKLIGMVLFVALIVEVVGNSFNLKLEDEAKNPLDANGKIKENYTISNEEEKVMTEQSFPKVEDKEYREQLMYAISQCIITSKSLDSYECIGNNIADSYFNKKQAQLSINLKGKIVYDTLTQGLTPTRVDTNPIQGGDNEYEMVISVLEKQIPFTYVITFDGKKIISIQLIESEVKL